MSKLFCVRPMEDINNNSQRSTHLRNKFCGVTFKTLIIIKNKICERNTVQEIFELLCLSLKALTQIIKKCIKTPGRVVNITNLTNIITSETVQADNAPTKKYLSLKKIWGLQEKGSEISKKNKHGPKY
ncbi:hypothetical protein MXB_1205 [Myxobolus squamalis]|nr:hypothetical protein MXB_1205 [Myxobolus squamalis]